MIIITSIIQLLTFLQSGSAIKYTKILNAGTLYWKKMHKLMQYSETVAKHQLFRKLITFTLNFI